MGIDKDYGVHAFSGTSFAGPGGIFGTYYHVPTLHFDVPETQLLDHQPPFLQLRIMTKLANGSTVEAGSAVPVGQMLWAEIRAGDNKDGDKMAALTCTVGSVGTVDSTVVTLNQNYKISTGSWRVPLAPDGRKLGEGHHVLDLYARDTSGNESRTHREIDLLNFKVGAALDGPPDADVILEPDRDHAKINLPIKIIFTKNVIIPSPNDLVLTQDTTGIPAPCQLISSAGMVTGSTTDRVFYLIPSPALQYGQNYTLTLSANVVGADGNSEPMVHNVYQFTTTPIQAQESWTLPFSPGRIAALGNRLFIQDIANKRVEALTLSSGANSSIPVEDISPNDGGDFLGQGIDSLELFPA